MQPVRRATVGRPVRFVGAESEEEDDFAVSRLREAFMAAGFEEVEFELEPVAAAFAYEATLDREELILIGDFGGGTSDFSLLRVGPELRRRGRRPEDLLGNSGVGLAGDAFDARIVRKLVSPALGIELRGALTQQNSPCGAGVDLRTPGALALSFVSAHQQCPRDTEKRADTGT